MSSLCPEVMRSLKQANQGSISLLLLSPAFYFALLIRVHRALDPPLNIFTNLDISFKPHLQPSACLCNAPARRAHVHAAVIPSKARLHLSEVACDSRGIL